MNEYSFIKKISKKIKITIYKPNFTLCQQKLDSVKTRAKQDPSHEVSTKRYGYQKNRIRNEVAREKLDVQLD